MGIPFAGFPLSMAARSKSSQRWLKEHFSDPFVKKAQADGMRSRAAYKLEELVERGKLLRPGMVVVDLGAAPRSTTTMPGLSSRSRASNSSSL